MKPKCPKCGKRRLGRWSASDVACGACRWTKRISDAAIIRLSVGPTKPETCKCSTRDKLGLKIDELRLSNEAKDAEIARLKSQAEEADSEIGWLEAEGATKDEEIARLKAAHERDMCADGHARIRYTPEEDFGPCPLCVLRMDYFGEPPE